MKKRDGRYKKYLEAVDQAHWQVGMCAPWKCSRCNEKDGWYVQPGTFYSEPIPVYDIYLRFEFSICPRCHMLLYGGVMKSKDLIKWENTDDLDPEIKEFRKKFETSVMSDLKSAFPDIKINEHWQGQKLIELKQKLLEDKNEK